VFIVAWYILQQFRVFSEEDLRRIMERIAQLHKLRPNPYYYEYYSASVTLNKLVFPRPAYIPQLRQALEAINFFFKAYEALPEKNQYREFAKKLHAQIHNF